MHWRSLSPADLYKQGQTATHRWTHRELEGWHHWAQHGYVTVCQVIENVLNHYGYNTRWMKYNIS